MAEKTGELMASVSTSSAPASKGDQARRAPSVEIVASEGKGFNVGSMMSNTVVYVFFDTFGIIDAVIPEPLGGAHNDIPAAAEALKNAVLAAITELSKVKGPKLLDDRYQKFRALGQFTEN